MKKVSVAILFQIILFALCAGGLFVWKTASPSGARTAALAAETAAPASDTISEAAPADLESLQRADDAQLDEWAEHLSRFDGRDYGIVTPARNQGGKLICWAYAAVGAAEASILRNGIAPDETKDTLNFDEVVAAYTPVVRSGAQDPLLLTTKDTTDGVWNKGGNSVNAFAAMTQGYTLIDDNYFGEYATNADIESKLAQSDYYVRSYQRIHNDPVSIKRAILQYGAVTFDYDSPNGYYDCYYDSSKSIDHASIIVGWDDTMDRTRFRPQQPTADGGWIVKNSWGPHGFLHDGVYCYYISYESHIGSDIYAIDMARRADYENLYYYDGNLAGSLRNYAADAQAAIFEAKLSGPTQREQLTAVSIVVSQSDLDATVTIYKHLDVNPGNVNDKRNRPDRGAPVATVKKHLDRQGMHTIDLDAPVELEQGEYFSVVVSCVSAYNTSVPVMCAVDGVASLNDMTYYLYKGEWTSYKKSNYYADTSTDCMAARIRAVTNTVPRGTDLGKDLRYARVEIPDRLLYYERDKQLRPEIRVLFDGTELAEGRDYRVELSDNTAPGPVTVTIVGINEYRGTRTTSFEIGMAKYPPGRMSGTITVYRDTVMLHDIPLPKDWRWINWDEALRFGRSEYQFSLKYEGADAAFYQIDTCDFYVLRLDEDPPADTDIADAVLEIGGVCIYTGEPIVPTVCVTYGGLTLREGIDYSVSCLDNIAAGEATVVVRGKGRYFGEKRGSFAIEKAKIPKNAPPSTLFVSRKAKTLRDVPLDGADWRWSAPETGIVEGLVALAVYDGADKENYETTEARVTIEREACKEIATITFLALSETRFVFDGTDKTPTVTARDGSVLLELGIDFTVRYENNRCAGEQARAIVTGINDYTGSATLTFAIDKAERLSFAVSQQGWTFGDPAPRPELSGEQESADVTFSYASGDSGVFSERLPTDAGVYRIKAVIAASGNYRAAESTATFEIGRKDLSAFTVTVAESGAVYNGEAICPSVTVGDGKTTLTEGTEYSLIYENNVDAGTDACVTVHGEGNYTGSIRTAFAIAKATEAAFDPTIRLEHRFEHLSEVGLPTDFEWIEDSLVVVSDNTMRATARYTGNNYTFETLGFTIVVDEADRTDPPKDRDLLWLLAIPAVVLPLAYVLLAVFLRRRLL